MEGGEDMGISIADWIRMKFSKGQTQVELDTYCGRIEAELYVKNLAIQTSINLLANALSLSEFETYENHKKVKKNNYYLFNVQPNLNKSASKFWRDVVHQLVFNNEALVIQQGGEFFVADEFEVVPFAFKENVYKNVVVADYSLSGSFVESEVFHFELHDQRIKNIIDGVYQQYGELIQYSTKTYKRSNAKRGVLNIPTNYPETELAQEKLNDLMQNKFKRFYEAEGGAVLPLANGLDYKDLSNSTYKNGSDSRDIRYLIDDVFDFVGIAFQIPPQLLKGTVADTSGVMNSFVALGVNPIAELLKDEINRKYYKKKGFENGDYLKINTDKIKMVGIKDLATAADILLRTGTHNQDENREMFDKEPLNTPESQRYYVTKNYEETGKQDEADRSR